MSRAFRKRRFPGYLLPLAAMAMLAACGGGGGESNTPVIVPTAGEYVAEFGTNGIATLQGGYFEGARATARFATAGSASSFIRAAGSVGGSSVRARLLPDGTADTSFAGSGRLLFPAEPPANPFSVTREGIAVFARPDGTELLVESVHVPCVTGPQCAITGGGYNATAARLVTPAGIPVPDYGNNTAEGEGVLGLDPRQAIAEPSGAVLVLGRDVAGPVGARRNALARLTPQGWPDEAFIANARAAIDCPGLDFLTSTGAAMARRADGKILLAQSFHKAYEEMPSRTCLSRLNPDGTLDASFGLAGRMLLEPLLFRVDRNTPVALFSLPNGGMSLFLQHDWTAADGLNRHTYVIVHLDANGAFDTSRFDQGVQGPTSLHVARLTAVAMQADGKYLIAGYPEIEPGTPGYVPGTANPIDPSRPRIGRLRHEGGADLYFGPTGSGYTSLLSYGRRLDPRHIGIGQGVVVVAGALGAAGPVNEGELTKFGIARLTGDSDAAQ